jgi:hypothetical protein
MGLGTMGGMGGRGVGGMDNPSPGGGMWPGGLGPGGMGGMMGGSGGLGRGGPGGMGRPVGMMGGPGMGPEGMMSHPGMGRGTPPPGYTSMPQMPHFPGGGGPPDRNAYASSTVSSATMREEAKPRRSSRRPVNPVSMGLFTKDVKSPKLSRSRTAPTTAERINRTGHNIGPSGKEWITGDAFLDACTCTTNCKCRGGHRVLYRSRSDAGSDSDSAHCRTGEIRYILKTDLGKDCGDHTGCKARSDTEDDEKQSKREKEKKKEEKKRKEQLDEFKDDILEALDQRFARLKADRSKAGSTGSSPRLPHARMGPEDFAHQGTMGPLMTQRAGAMIPGTMGMPSRGMGMMGAPYPTGVANMPPDMSGVPVIPPGVRALRPGQVHYDGLMSVMDMENLGIGNPYVGNAAAAQGLQARYMSPGRRKLDGINYEANLRRTLGEGGNRRPRGQGRPLRRGVESDDTDFEERSQQMGKRTGDGVGGGELYRPQ